MNSRLAAYLLLILATAVWGFGGPIVKYSFEFTTPFQFLFWRFVITSIITLPIFIIYLKKHPLQLNKLPKILLLGLFAMPLNLSLGFFGLRYTSVIEAAIIGSLGPIIIALSGAYFLHERLNLRKRTGIGLALLGSLTIIFEPVLTGNFASGEKAFLGNVLIFLSILAWAAFVILSKKWESEGTRAFHIVSVSFFVGLISFFVLASLEASSLPSLSSLNAQAVPGIVYMAVFSSLIAYTAYEVALTKIDVSEADLFTYLGPLWAIPLAVIWLGETFKPFFVLSGVLILTGVAIAEYRKGIVKGFRGHHLSHHR